jgi:hypothetical protein
MATLDRLWRTFTASLKLDIPRIDGPVWVVGSAPDTLSHTTPREGCKVITVNGSQAVLDHGGPRKPDYAIIRDTSTGVIGDAEIRKVLTGRGADNLVGVRLDRSTEALRREVAEFDYRYNRIFAVDHAQKDRLMFQVVHATGWFGAGRMFPSHGIFAIALARFLGGDPIVVTGFSLSRNGHAYMQSGIARLHIEDDRVFLRAMAASRFNLFTIDREFAKESGLRLWAG